jgi:hypothetical protein
MVTQVGYSVAGRLRGQMALCAICTVHMRRGVRVSWLSLKTKVYGLSVVWPQNHLDHFLRFSLKTGGDGFLRFGLKTGGDGFLHFGLKTGGDGFMVEPQNQGGGGFPGLGLKTGSYDLMI